MSWELGKPMATKRERPDGLAKRITDMRMEMNMSQNELARRINVNRTTIYYYEMGINTPKGPRLMLLADAFQTTADYLITGDGARWKTGAKLPWKTHKDLRGRIFCPYCGKGNGWAVRDLEYNGLPMPGYCNWCGRKVQT